MALELACLVIAVAVLVAAFRRAWRPMHSFESHDEERGLPYELRGARLAHAEETFKSERHRTVARLDRAYDVDGQLVLVEFKTRQAPVVYPSDIVELSVQRVALQDDRQVQVSTTAWVVVEDGTTGTRTSHRVRLLESEEVDALRMRYLGLLSGRVQDARGARSAGQCHHCGHRSVCDLRRR